MAIAPAGKRMTKAREARTPCAMSIVRRSEDMAPPAPIEVKPPFPELASSQYGSSCRFASLFGLSSSPSPHGPRPVGQADGRAVAQEGRPHLVRLSSSSSSSEVCVGLLPEPVRVAEPPVACAPCRGIQLVAVDPPDPVPLATGAAFTSGLTLLPPFALA